MASVKFHIRKSTQKEASIYLIFTLDRERRFEITLDERVEAKYWNKKDQCVKGTHPRHLEINLYLQQQKTSLLNLWSENRNVEFSKFKALATADRSQKKTLFIAYSQFIESYKLEKDSKTVVKHQALLRHLETFDQSYPIDFPALDFNFYDRFKAYLYAIPNQFYLKYSLVNKGEFWELEEGNHGEPVGIFDDQVYKQITEFRTFLAWAEKRSYQVNQSYKTWPIIRRIHPPITLTKEELEKLEKHCFKSEALDIARDYLVFECRTGVRISDIKRFNLKDFSGLKWTFTPKKGNRLSSKIVSVFFTGYCTNALEILQKHNWKMPEVSEQKLNLNMKKACQEAGIDSEISQFRWAANMHVRFKGPKYEFISSHCGRKTFITLALQSGMPVEYVMKLTGISEYKTIKHYRGNFDDKTIEGYLEGIEGKTIMKKSV